MMKLFTKVALVAALAGLTMAGTTGDGFARGYKAKSYCAPGTWRVTRGTCGSWGCHYQKCVWTGTPQTSWMISPAFCLNPWCPKY